MFRLDDEKYWIRWLRRQLFVSAFLFAVVCSAAQMARAVCPPEVSRISVTKPNKSRALAFFNAGMSLLAKHDCEGALELFLQSRAFSPRPSNIKNAAICLLELNRLPEALAFYQEILARFPNDIDVAERKAIAAKVEELERKIIIVDIDEQEGMLSIDGNACGALPRSAPVYLMPGSHIGLVSRAGKSETVKKFAATAGTRIVLEFPRPLAPQSRPLSPAVGKWFVEGGGGLAVGWSGIGFDDNVQLTSLLGGMVQARGGYRMSNGASAALTSGVLYVYSSDEFDRGQQIPNTTIMVTGKHSVPLFAPYMGVTAGWETQFNNQFDVWFRAGFGLLAAQSKNAVEVNLQDGDVDISADVAGLDVVRSVPAYASADVGAAVHVGPVKIGLSLGTLFLMVNGPRLPDVTITPRDIEPSELGAVRLQGAYAYRPMFLFVPQLVIGIAP